MISRKFLAQKLVNMDRSDLLKRTLSGIVYLASLIVAILWVKTAIPVFAIVFMINMFKEFYGVSLGSLYQRERRLTVLCACVLFTLVYIVVGAELDWRFILAPFAILVITFISVIFEKDRSTLEKLPWIFEGLVYIAFPVCLLPFLCFKGGEYNSLFLLSFLIIMCMSDTGAYVFGTAFGQRPGSRKLAPSISPKKSWVGFWGGLIVCVGASIACHYLGWLDLPLIHCILLSALCSVAGVCGDLFESVWKRYFGIKDSGCMMPGHGGYLDRFDSSLFAIPVCVAYLAIFNLL